LIRHPDGIALDPGSGAGVTLRVNWVRLGSFLAAPVRGSLFVVHRIKRLRVIFLILKMGSFVHFLVHRFHRFFNANVAKDARDANVFFCKLRFWNAFGMAFCFFVFQVFKLPAGCRRYNLLPPPYIGANLRILVEMAKWRGGLKSVNACE
jgi:hypothetical protein